MNDKFTRSELEMVYQYAAPTKEETLAGLKEIVPVIRDAHARLPVVQKQAVSPVIITALMHKAAGCPVLPVVHAGRLIVHGSIPLSGQAPDFSGRFLSCASALLWLSALWLRLSGGG